MGLQDRDYMRNDALRTSSQPRPSWWRNLSAAGVITTTTLAVALVSAALWLWRDAKSTFNEPPSKGSLVVNLNTGTSEELQTIPNVGQARAALVIEHRKTTPFKAVEDLYQVKGIPKSVVRGVLPYVTVSESTHKKPAPGS